MHRVHFRTKKSGVPILSDRDIDKDAEMILRDYKPEFLMRPQPLDVDDFVESYLRLNLHYDNLSHNGCIWGRMVFNNRRIPVYDPESQKAVYRPIDANTIVIDNQLLGVQSEYAYRSTVIHEAGHGIYHQAVYCKSDVQMYAFASDGAQPTQCTTVCRSIDVRAGQRMLITDHDWIEHHAKYFSAAILMPRMAMRILCEDPDLRHDLTEEFPTGSVANDMLASIVSSRFNVSPTSAKIRIEQLGLSLVPPQKQALPMSGFLDWDTHYEF